MQSLRTAISGERIYGLDILRAFAILFVIVEHASNLLKEETAQFQKSMILDGVSIFFVLSGFLIGGILIKLLETKKPEPRLLMNFWSRRWLRTLPAYFTVLILLIIYQYAVTPEFKLSDFSSYFFFLQNFNSPHPNFFGEAWSLSIEEWFYVFIPILLFLLVGLIKIPPKKAIMACAISLIILTICYRYVKFVNVPVNSFNDWDEFFRKQVLTRLDALMFGVIGAYLSFYYKEFWVKNRLIFLFLGIAILIIDNVITKNSLFGVGLYSCVFSFSVSALGTLLVLPYLSGLKSGSGILFRFITSISLISYSLYLVNLSLVQVVIFTSLNLNTELGDLLIYTAYWILTFVLATLLYRLVETPFMDLRKKLAPEEMNTVG